jgi:hypothetical protein
VVSVLLALVVEALELQAEQTRALAVVVVLGLDMFSPVDQAVQE